MVLSVHAAAKEEAVWPLGKDQLPGFLPTTSARTTSMNGRWRRKKALTGNSTTHVAPLRHGRRTTSARPARSTPAARATISGTAQIQPPVVQVVTTPASRSLHAG